MTKHLLGAAVAAFILLPLSSHAADPARQAEVAGRGADVMPFDLKATTHIFTKTADGGVQRVVAKNAADKRQVELIRAHLHEIQGQFRKGDFSGPSHIHGDQMPGLSQLQTAAPGQIAIDYREVAGGAELTYRTVDPKLVSSLQDWFDAQLSDHGPDAMAGHHHMHDRMPQR
ncbi:aspartate carbamoyltransferase [Variovorax sp. YR216]|uniref:aspartate carbamoyltransferase n=1 Tax=Variovorax sp. YR216 TaxID=1882828 RepID=UPI00089B2050|nr:aspartate carbamoyltransferase [Variovorax sp. YR216]SEB14361.1 hypothetical protein SAMN05444680_109139 [Variovorax sp. YR216]